MHATIRISGRTQVTEDQVRVRDALRGDEFAWVDVETTAPDPGAALNPAVDTIARLLGFVQPHDSWLGRFDESPRFEVSDQAARAVVDVGAGRDRIPIHIVVTPNFMLTLHPRPLPALARLIADFEAPAERPGATAAFLCLKAVLAHVREEIKTIRDELDSLEDAMFRRPSRVQLERLANVRTRIVATRHTLGPYRDAVDDFMSQLLVMNELPPFQQELVRAHASDIGALAHAVDLLQDAAGHSMEAYMSLLATRQGQVINRLTIVSLVFLPLTYITSFFGMNFLALTNGVDSSAAFWLLGVGFQLLLLVASIAMISRLGWFAMFRDPQRRD